MRPISLALILCLLAAGVTAQSLVTQPAAAPQATAFAACPDPGRWGTSADYLRRAARCAYGEDSVQGLRVALIEDIYIKSWSYAVLNKGFFWASILLAMLVLAWPGLGAILDRPAHAPAVAPAVTATAPPEPRPSLLQRALASSSVQTSVTALAAFCFAFYAHYKEKQAVSETLMRTVLFAETVDQDLVDRMVAEMTELDKGFGFATLATKPVPQGGQ